VVDGEKKMMNSNLANQSEHQLPNEQSAATLDHAADVTAADPANAPRSRQCIKLKADGSRCQGQALTGSSQCFFHDPASANQRAAASRRGGERNRAAALPSDTPDAPLNNACDAGALLARSINQLLRGQLDPKIANAVGYLLSVKMRTTDVAKLEQRMAALERALKEQRPEPTLSDTGDEFGGEV
jgi:hypothetical protein